MPKKTSSVKVFKAEKPQAKSPVIAKLQITKRPVDDIMAEFARLLDQAKKAGINPVFGRGMISLY